MRIDLQRNTVTTVEYMIYNKNMKIYNQFRTASPFYTNLKKMFILGWSKILSFDR